MKGNKRGITLIALVVTIVVLLILAGVSINLIMNDNGIIQRSKDAKRVHEQASENEQKELSDLSDLIEKSIGKIEYNEELKKLKPGDYVIYNTGIEGVGEVTCRVLYDAESLYNLQIITDDCIKKNGEYVYIPMGSIYILKERLDKDNSNLKKQFKDYDFSEWYNDYAGHTDSYVYEGYKLYNNAITELNNKAMEFCNNMYADDARCVGSNPKNKERENKEYAVFPEGTINRYSGEDMTGMKSDGKDEDDNSEIDYNELQRLDMLNTNKYYWFASRYKEVGEIYSTDKGISFYMRNNGGYEYYEGGSYGKTAGGVLINAGPAGAMSMKYAINALRPVFTLKGNLKVVSGDGTSESTAYRLGV